MSDLDAAVTAIVAAAIAPVLAKLEGAQAELGALAGELTELRSQLETVKRAPERPVYVTVAQATARIGCSTRTIRRAIDGRELPARRLPSGHVRIAVSDLDATLRVQEPRPKTLAPVKGAR